MKEEFIKRAKEVGLGYANDLYKDMSNPENQWPNFNWRKVFLRMCGRVAKVSLFLCFTDKEYTSMTTEEIDQLENISYNTAVKRAEELVEEYIDGDSSRR